MKQERDDRSDSEDELISFSGIASWSHLHMHFTHHVLKMIMRQDFRLSKAKKTR